MAISRAIRNKWNAKKEISTPGKATYQSKYDLDHIDQNLPAADRAKQRRKEEEVAAHRAAMRGGLKEYARRELGKEEALALADLRRRIEEDMLAETAEVDEELLAITRRLEELQRPPTGRLLKKEMQRRAAEAMELSLAKVRRDRDDRIEAQRQAREAELRYKTWLEARMKDHEEGISTPRTSNRRKLLRTVQLAMLRQTEGFMICEWGCKEWLHAGADVVLHTTQLCVKRLLPCVLGCGEQQREEVWLAPPAAPGQGPGTTYQQFHEEVECPCRLVPCPRKCGEWVKRNELGHHMAELCVKRPFPGLKCRLGCGAVFEGGHHRMLQCEEERVEHEREECPHRLVRCMWDDCGRMIEACKRKEHKEEHIMSLGIAVFNLANIEGFHKYKVTGGATQLKVLAWGGGGGSGGGVGRHAGAGGGGAFVEALIAVNPGDILKILVGGGGGAGVFATPSAELGYGAFDVGVALGGYPGGGNGHGGNDLWAAGGGGGYSFLQIQPRDGVETETVLVAAGGGGGGSRDGVPGGGLRGELPGTKIDKRNGRLGTASGPGEGGDSGDVASTRFPAENGRAWVGGAGAEFGGGGGGGIYGGGGGGTAPGIVGGGGGGGSFVNPAFCTDFVVLQGEGRLPGGHERLPPDAVGVGEWDRTGGRAGEGGRANPKVFSNGNAGAVIIMKPGFY